MLPLAIVVPPVAVLPLAVVVPPVVKSPVVVVMPRVAVVVPRRRVVRRRRRAACHPAAPCRRRLHSLGTHQEPVERRTPARLMRNLRVVGVKGFQTPPSQNGQRDIARGQELHLMPTDSPPVYATKHTSHKSGGRCDPHLKKHFLAGIAGLPKSFPIVNWCQLTTQCDATLNMLRPCRQNPLLSAHEALEGSFSFDTTPTGFTLRPTDAAHGDTTHPKLGIFPIQPTNTAASEF